VAGELGVAEASGDPPGLTGTMTKGEFDDGLGVGAGTEALRLPLLMIAGESELMGGRLSEMLWLFDPAGMLAGVEATAVEGGLDELGAGALALEAGSLLELGASPLLVPAGEALLDPDLGVVALSQVPREPGGFGVASCENGENSTDDPGFGKAKRRESAFTVQVPGRFAAKMEGLSSK
jgi:hypothetical protein